MLALKGNQETLHEEVSGFFDGALARGLDTELERHSTVEKGHGRIEERTVWLSRKFYAAFAKETLPKTSPV